MSQEDQIAKLETEIAQLKKDIFQCRFDLDNLKSQFEDWEMKKRRKETGLD